MPADNEVKAVSVVFNPSIVTRAPLSLGGKRQMKMSTGGPHLTHFALANVYQRSLWVRFTCVRTLAHALGNSAPSSRRRKRTGPLVERMSALWTCLRVCLALALCTKRDATQLTCGRSSSRSRQEKEGKEKESGLLFGAFPPSNIGAVTLCVLYRQNGMRLLFVSCVPMIYPHQELKMGYKSMTQKQVLRAPQSSGCKYSRTYASCFPSVVEMPSSLAQIQGNEKKNGL